MKLENVQQWAETKAAGTTEIVSYPNGLMSPLERICANYVFHPCVTCSRL